MFNMFLVFLTIILFKWTVIMTSPKDLIKSLKRLT
jgi:hypothetical protein